MLILLNLTYKATSNYWLAFSSLWISCRFVGGAVCLFVYYYRLLGVI